MNTKLHITGLGVKVGVIDTGNALQLLAVQCCSAVLANLSRHKLLARLSAPMCASIRQR